MKGLRVGFTLLIVTLGVSIAPAAAQELVFGPETYIRTGESPNVFTAVFAARVGEGRISVTSGDEQGEHRVDSARVTMNGSQVLGPETFNPTVQALEADVSLAAENTLVVELMGPPGSRLTIAVSRAFHEDVPAWRMPELAVVDLTPTSALADPGAAVDIVATVQNTGRGVTPRATLTLSMDGDELCTAAVQPLEPGGLVPFNCVWTAQGAGRHVVRAELDVPAGEFDGSLANNLAVATVRVSGESDPEPEVEVLSGDLDAVPFNSGESYVLPLRVRNTSFAELTNIRVEAYVDGAAACILPEGYTPPASDDVLPPPIDCLAEIEYLGPGDETGLQMLWLEATPGEHVVATQVVDTSDPDLPILAVTSWLVVPPDQTVLYETPGLAQWASLGPKKLHDDWTGRITSIAFDPTNPQIAYACGMGNDFNIPAGAGVWKTTNGGSTWSPLGDRLPSMLIRNLAVDPNHTSAIYASGPTGIFKSINGGLNWSHFAGPNIGKDAILFVGATPLGEVLIYAGTEQALLRYKNADPWELTSDASEWDVIKNMSVRDLAVHPTDDSTVYIASGDRLYRTNVGATMDPATADLYWTQLHTGLPADLSSVRLDIHERFPERVYAGIAKPTPYLDFAIYRSDDGGDSWSQVIGYAPGALAGGLYNPFIRVVPSPYPEAEILYFGGVVLYQFINYPIGILKKLTLKQRAMFSADMKDLEFVPGKEDTTYWLANDQGIFECTIHTIPQDLPPKDQVYGVSGDVSVARNTDLRVTELYDIDISGQGRIIGGTQDTGTILYQGNPIWKHVKGGDGLYSLFNPHSEDIVYGQEQNFSDTTRSGDRGGTWLPIATGMPQGHGDGAFITTAPDWTDIILALGGGDGLYFHIAPGVFPFVPWAKIEVDTAMYGGVTRILAAPVVPGSASWWLAGTSKGKIIVPWGSTFKTVFTHPSGLMVRNLAVSPLDPRVIYAAFASSTKSRLWRIYLDTTNPAASIPTDITDNFPSNLTPLALCADPYALDVVYVGTERGVMWRDPSCYNSFCAWQPYNDGLPLTSVTDLVVSPADNMLVAATKGRGAWGVLTGP